ncbi:MAG: ABC transporter ATP-binding protein [Betaproteobacteria bacterium]|nr:ABC transporter ATP-binding protein [Betaproteobacteria bacterium]
MPLLEVRQVSKQFGGVRAVHEVSFEVVAGEIVGLMGANGAGKTTLLALIAGQVIPDSGDVLFEQHSLRGMTSDAVCRRGIARAFQIVKPFAGMSVLDNLITAAYFGPIALRSREQAESHCRDVLDEFALTDVAERLASSLTLSEQKRLELARAVASGAKLLLIDEVMAGLTPTEVAAMLERLRAVHARRQLTMIVIEHVMQALMRLADRIVVLHHGECIAQGAPAEVARDARVLEVYFGEAA